LRKLLTFINISGIIEIYDGGIVSINLKINCGRLVSGKDYTNNLFPSTINKVWPTGYQHEFYEYLQKAFVELQFDEIEMLGIKKNYNPEILEFYIKIPKLPNLDEEETYSRLVMNMTNGEYFVTHLVQQDFEMLANHGY